MSSSVRSGSDKALRVGVIGLGWAGRQHLEAYQGIEGVQVVGLAGKEADLLAELGAAHRVPALFEGWEELIALPGLDAVSVAVPTFLHAPITIAALDKGLHVLSEKPIARNAAEGQEMVDAARRSGRVLDVAFNHRRRGDIGALKTIIDAGELGRPYYAKASWLRRSGIPGLGSWFTSRELAGGGPLADIGVHVFGLCSLPAGRTQSCCRVGGYLRGARTKGSRRFESRGRGRFQVAIRGRGLRLRVPPARRWGNATDRGGLGELPESGRSDGLHRVRHRRGRRTADRGCVGNAGRDLERLHRGGWAQRRPGGPALPGRAHQHVVEDFVDVVRGDPAGWTAHDGSLALSRATIIDAAYRSARENREIQL